MRLGNVNITVTVKVSDLIAALEVNRQKHIDQYADAVQGYFTQLRARLETLLDSASDGKFRDDGYSVHLAKPVNAEKMYNQYIRMLKMATNETMELSTHEYQCFVEDEWDWAQTAKTTNAFYSSR